MDYNPPKNFIEFKYGWHRNIDFKNEAELLKDILDEAEKENDIQHYIKSNGKWFIPASLFEEYNFGHHEAYIAPEQALGNEYRVDYMLLGRNSIGHQIILVEFEDVNVDYKLKNSNMESESARKGLIQIRDWKRWMDDNRQYFIKSCGLYDIGRNIPSWGIYYCLVVGRRNRMDDVANQMRGQSQRDTPGLRIVSYDRLIDNVRKLSNGF